MVTVYTFTCRHTNGGNGGNVEKGRGDSVDDTGSSGLYTSGADGYVLLHMRYGPPPSTVEFILALALLALVLVLVYLPYIIK
jgi:hypothetical protein